MNEEDHSEEERLIAKHLTGQVTAEEEKALQEWIVLNNENEQTYLNIRKSYVLSGEHYSPKIHDNIDVNVDKEWDRFVKEVDQKETSKMLRFVPERSQLNVWLRIAAAILLLVVSGVVINFFVLKSGEQVYQTAQNIETVILPDGSKVFLNRNSKLSYSKTFGEKNREVSLTGEGFFEVLSNAQSLFVVKVDKAEVSVLGTSFNVQGYSNKSEIEVTVEAGIVQLTSTENQQSVKLVAGEKGIFIKQQKELVHKKNENTNYLSWKTKRIEFDGSSLTSVVETLRAIYGVDLVISTTISDTCEVTVIFDNQPLEAVLSVLKSTLNLTYKVEGGKIEIIGAGC